MSAPAPEHTTAAPRATAASASGARLLQRKCGCGASNGGVGDECAKCQGMRLQRKLAVGATNDPLEAEADRVAAEVVARPSLPGGLSHAPPRIQRLETNAVAARDAAPASVERVLSDPGRPLEPEVRADMEQRFGYDFSKVRIHTGPLAERSASDLKARAYVAGESIVLGSGQYTPRTSEGRRLLAHELTHVEQQRTSKSAGAAIRRSNGGASPPAPSPPNWLPQSLRGTAVHIQGNVWEVRIRGLGATPIGPYDEVAAYLQQIRPTLREPMQAAHIIGGEHMRDLKWTMPYERGPSVGVSESLHQKWTSEIASHQSQRGLMGGRAGAVGRPFVGVDDVIHLHHEVYRGFPDLQAIAKRIVTTVSQEMARAQMSTRFRKPPAQSPMDAHQRADLTKKPSPMDAHRKPDMGPKPGPMDAHQRPDVSARQSPMDSHQRPDMTRKPSPMDAHKRPDLSKPPPVTAPKPELGRWGGAKLGLKQAFTPKNIAGGLVAEIPMIVLHFADRAAASEASRHIQVKFAKEGYGKGIAAAVMGWTADEVGSKLMNHVTSYRVRGLGDAAGHLGAAYIFQLAQAYENYGVAVGYEFARAQTLDWLGGLRTRGFEALLSRGYRFADDPALLFEYEFIDKLAYVLRSVTDPMADAAISRAEALRKAAQERAARQAKEESGCIGMKC